MTTKNGVLYDERLHVPLRSRQHSIRRFEFDAWLLALAEPHSATARRALASRRTALSCSTTSTRKKNSGTRITAAPTLSLA